MKRTIDWSSLALISEVQLWEMSRDPQIVLEQIEKIDGAGYLVEWFYKGLMRRMSNKIKK